MSILSALGLSGTKKKSAVVKAKGNARKLRNNAGPVTQARAKYEAAFKRWSRKGRAGGSPVDAAECIEAAAELVKRKAATWDTFDPRIVELAKRGRS